MVQKRKEKKSDPETNTLHVIVNQPTSNPVIVRMPSGYDAVLSFNSAASFRHTSMG